MILESIGLTIAFLLISTTLLWVLIRSKTPIIVKFLLIFAVLWYGVVLLNIPGSFMGWPKFMLEKDYKGQYVKDYFILEPTKKGKGAIYLWLIDQVEVKAVKLRIDNKLKPTEMFLIKWIGVPRAYSLKYSRNLHKKMLEVRRKAKNTPGSFIKIKRRKGNSGEKEGHDAKIEFEIINPRNVFVKEE